MSTPGTIDIASIDHTAAPPSAQTLAEAVAFPLYRLGIGLTITASFGSCGLEIDVYPDHEPGESYTVLLYQLLMTLIEDSDTTPAQVAADLEGLARLITTSRATP